MGGRKRIGRLIAVVLTAALVTSQPPVDAQDAAAPVFPAPRSGLLPVPLPSLGSVETAVVQHIDEALKSVRAGAASGDADRGVLAEAYGRLGQVFHAYEFFEAAAASYDNARRLAPRDYRWPHLLAYLREQTGAFDEAVDLYLAALRLEPADHAADVRLGIAYLQMDRRGEARSRFDAQRSRFPASSLAGLGEIALRERRFEDAIRLFDDALRRAPHASSLHYSVGMAFRGLGRLDEAQQHLSRMGPGRVRPADPLVDALPALLRGYRAPLNQARVELEGGALEAAAVMFRRALEAAPDDMDERSTVELAFHLADQKHFGDAIRLLRSAHERFPEHEATATTLARLLAAAPDLSLRNGARALEIAMKVYERRPTPAHGETVALALAELGSCREAGEWLQRAIVQAGRDGDASEAARLRAVASRYDRSPCR